MQRSDPATGNSAWLWRRLNLPLGVATFLAIGLHLVWPAEGFWLNLSTVFIGSIVAVNYVDKAMARRSRQEWRGAVELVANRIQLVTCGLITNIRAALGISADQLPFKLSSQTMTADYLAMCEEVIEPQAVQKVLSLDQNGWTKLSRALQNGYTEYQGLLTLFGNQLRPDHVREMLALQDSIRGVLGVHTTFPDVLGVDDLKLPPNRFGDMVEFKWEMTRRLADDVARVLTETRRLGLKAIDFHENPI